VAKEVIVPEPAKASGRIRIISANWKMNHNHLEAIAVMERLYHALKPEDYRFAELTIHPPFTDLRSLQLLFESDRMPFVLGAQNCHQEDRGAYTGEISASMLSKLGVGYVIVGHSERRAYFHESSELVAAKALAVHRHGMKPIICVGETLEQREAGETNEVVSGQLAPVLSSFPVADFDQVVIAYEPVWAIGTGRAALPEDAEAVVTRIRNDIAKAIGDEIANKIRIQYGGSVNAGNAHDFMSVPGVDGLLVGTASLDPDSYARLIQSA
jgi:triosephosphate isomerase